MSSVWGSFSLVLQRSLRENKAKEEKPGFLYLLSVEEGAEAYLSLMGRCKVICHKLSGVQLSPYNLVFILSLLPPSLPPLSLSLSLSLSHSHSLTHSLTHTHTHTHV